MRVEIIDLKRREDPRGHLLKVLMRHQIEGEHEFGEIYVCSSRPGEVRGHHYHESATEWFCVIAGKGQLLLQEVDSRESCTIELDSEEPRVVMVPPRMAHAIENVGTQTLCLLAYADMPYDDAAPDMQSYKVLPDA